MSVRCRPSPDEQRPRALPLAERRADRGSQALARRPPLRRFVADCEIEAPAMRPPVVRSGDAKPRLCPLVRKVGKILLVANAEFRLPRPSTPATARRPRSQSAPVRSSTQSRRFRRLPGGGLRQAGSHPGTRRTQGPSSRRPSPAKRRPARRHHGTRPAESDAGRVGTGTARPTGRHRPRGRLPGCGSG